MAITLEQITDRVTARLDEEGSNKMGSGQIWSIVHAEIKRAYNTMLSYPVSYGGSFYGESAYLEVTTTKYPATGTTVYTEYHVDLSSIGYSKILKVIDPSTSKLIPEAPTDGEMEAWANSGEHENEIFWREFGQKLHVKKGDKATYPTHLQVWYYRFPRDASLDSNGDGILDNNKLDMPDTWEATIIDNVIKHVLRKLQRREMSQDVNTDATQALETMRRSANEDMIIEQQEKAK